MKTMNTGRKTLLALAVSSVMAGWSVNSFATDTPVGPPDLSGDWTVNEGESFTSENGSVISQTIDSKATITNNGIISGKVHAINVLDGGRLNEVRNNDNGLISSETGAAIYVEDGGTIGYIKNNGTIVGGMVGDEQVAIDIRLDKKSKKQQVWLGDTPGKGGIVEGNIYLNNALNTAVYIYGSESDKAVFDGVKISGAKNINNGSKDHAGYLLLKAQDTTIEFDLALQDGSKGKFTNQSGSGLEFELSGDLCDTPEDESPCTTAVLDVNGDMEFKGNNTIYVTGEIEKVAGKHTLVTADKITGFEDNMVQGTWMTDVEVIGTGSDGSIEVEVTYNEELDPNELIANADSHGADATEQAVLGAFAGIIADSENLEITRDSITFTGEKADVLGELTNLLTNGGVGADAVKLAGELTPDRSGAKLHAAQRAQNKQLDAISHRMNSLRADQYHAVNASNSGLWMQVYGNDAKKDVSGRIDGYDAKGMGFSIGVDGDLTNNIVAGMALSQNYQDIDTITYDSNYEVNTYQLSAYALWNQDNYFVTGAVNGGINYYDSYRTIGEGVAGITDPRAAAEFSGFHFGARVTAGMDLAFDNILLQPIVAAELNRVELENYAESGSVASLGYEKQTTSQAKLGAGVNASTTFELGNGILTPSLSAMGWYDFKADNQNIAGYIVMDPTVEGTITTANGSSKTRFEMRAGVDYTSSGALSFGLGLQHAVEDDTRDSQVQLRMNYAF